MNEPHDPFELDPVEPEAPDPFEAELAGQLGSLVRHELPPYDLAARAEARAGAYVSAHRRRSLARGGGAALLAAAAVWAAVTVGVGMGDRAPEISTGNGPHSSVRATTTTTSSSSTTTSSTTTTTRPGLDGGVDDPTSPTTVPTTLAGGGSGGTTDPTPAEPKCFKATGKPNTVREDWAAGQGDSSPAAFWRTQPAADQPLELEVCLPVADLTPVVGQTVTVTLRATDPDQAFDERSCNGPAVQWGDTARILSLCNDAVPPPPTTPAKTPEPGPKGQVSLTFTHVYTEAGPFTIVASATSGPDSGRPEPYRSSASLEVPITVRAAP